MPSAPAPPLPAPASTFRPSPPEPKAPLRLKKKVSSSLSNEETELMLAPAYVPTHEYAVSSAMRGLTSGFGMEPGVPPSLWEPTNMFRVIRRKMMTRSDSEHYSRPMAARCSIQLVGSEEREVSRFRPISTGKLQVLPLFHTQPINLVVYQGSSPYGEISYLEAGFPLRCFQRLSLPHIATLLCRWHDNRSTRGASIPVFSY